MEDADFALALHLQQQFEEELGEECIGLPESLQNPSRLISSQSNSPKRKQLRDIQRGDHGSSRLFSVVDESWELVDPNPDIYSLFQEFNSTFFWRQLDGVEVKWSQRMTSCAGICCYEGRGGLCSVRLSVPLLKLRPRKDLVQTLLHEMIHAYLFVTDNNKDHDGHGPEFHKHMFRINKMTGANVSVYHNFYDEVKLYKQHWWRCSGPCRDRKPYFGYVKRASNRAPAPNDFWWEDHKKTCNGEFIKIKEPENYKKKEKGTSKVPVPEKKRKREGTDIRSFFEKSPPKPQSTHTILSNVHTFSSPVKSSSSRDVKTSPVKKSSIFGATNTHIVSGSRSTNTSLFKRSSSTVTIYGGTGHVSGSNNAKTSPVRKLSGSCNTKASPVKKPSSTVSIFGGTGHVLGKKT